MKHLIIESRKHELVIEGEKDSIIKLGGVFSQWDTKNNNNRVYEKSPLIREVDKLRGLIDQGRLVGELDHPASPKVNLDRVSHKIVDLSVDEGKKSVHGSIELLDTDMGRNAKAILDSGVKLAISSRATGELEEKDDGTLLVGDSLNMITYDIVLMPGVDDAILGIQESMDQDFVILTTEEYAALSSGDFDKTVEARVQERLKRMGEKLLIAGLKEALSKK